MQTVLAIEQTKIVSGKVRLRPIALPIEHGGWSLLLEPIALGLLLAPTMGGIFLALAAVGAFLTRQPFKLAVSDFVRRRRTPRTPIAVRFAGLYLFITAVFLGIAFKTAQGDFWLPLVVAAPIVLVQLFFDSQARSRALPAELSGAIATGAMASAIALCDGWTRPAALVLWAIAIARSVPTILYLRARLRLLHHKPASLVVGDVAHLIALTSLVMFAKNNLAPRLAAVAATLLLLRAIIGFQSAKKQPTAKMLGVRELIFGAVFVVMVVVGYRLGW